MPEIRFPFIFHRVRGTLQMRSTCTNEVNLLGVMILKKLLIIFVSAIVILLTLPLSYVATRNNQPPEQSREELYQDLFITLLGSPIDRAVAAYYSKIMTESPTVYPYSVKIIQAKRQYGYRSFGFQIILEVTPVVGPHISVGTDRITFTISSAQVTVDKYEHLQTHPLPPHWQQILKK